jgi:hypothetical protein
MATEQQIRSAILKVAGNPDSGPIKALADDMARAIVALDNPPSQPMKEKRVSHPAEIR